VAKKTFTINILYNILYKYNLKIRHQFNYQEPTAMLRFDVPQVNANVVRFEAFITFLFCAIALVNDGLKTAKSGGVISGR